MNRFFQWIDSCVTLAERGEKAVVKLVETLVKVRLRPLADFLLTFLAVGRAGEPVEVEKHTQVNPAIPRGPFRQDREPALIVYVPRDLSGWIINHLSGSYGYSHVTVDCGETDLDTGKPVMIESTTGSLVRRRFLDAYGDRHSARLPLKQIGVMDEPFCSCVTSKVGEQYDYLEALTWGEVDDPSKQVCSDLAADCLPDSMRHDIGEAQYEARIDKLSVSVHHRENGEIDVFVSPNGFCQYFGAPRGRTLSHPNQAVPLRGIARPRPRRPWLGRLGWLAAGLTMAAAAYWLASRYRKDQPQRAQRTPGIEKEKIREERKLFASPSAGG